MQLNTVTEVRKHMRSKRTKQAAFLTTEGTHVLVQIDRDGDIGLIDPGSHIAWKYLRNARWIWPLTPLEPPN